MLGIAEMFAELDGYQRYESALEQWSAWRTSRGYQRKTVPLSPEEALRRRRERARLYMNKRYREDAEFRARHQKAARARYYVPRANAAKHGTVSKYNSGDGCRCDACREAMAQYKRDWRERRAA